MDSTSNDKFRRKKSIAQHNHNAQYDAIAEDFQNADKTFPDVTRPILYDYYKNMDLKDKSLLDLGCGYGSDLKYFVSRGANVFGVDESEKQVNLARINCPQATVLTAKTEELPFEDNSIDNIFSRYAIQHSKEIEPVFIETNRVLAVGGDFVFLVTHPFRQFFEKPTRDYWKKEKVTCNILGSKLNVQEYSHTLEEYLNSPILKKSFQLLDMKSEYDPGAYHEESNGKYPDIWILNYRKILL